MRIFNVYGFRLFEAEGTDGGSPEPDVTKKLERLEYLEKEHKELIAARDKAKEEKRKQEEAKLLGEKKFQELLAQREKELESLKQKADALDQYKTAKVAEAKEALGDSWDDEYSNLSISALEKMVKSTTAKVVDVDKGGSRGDNKLSESEKAQAKRMGLSEESYLRFKDTQKRLKGE